ncbi:MAG: hypothetical protein IPM35_34080 [Myxococcales bacterium]|nr:hypothetical protein [Myxococcales bacterium]
MRWLAWTRTTRSSRRTIVFRRVVSGAIAMYAAQGAYRLEAASTYVASAFAPEMDEPRALLVGRLVGWAMAVASLTAGCWLARTPLVIALYRPGVPA